MDESTTPAPTQINVSRKLRFTPRFCVGQVAHRKSDLQIEKEFMATIFASERNNQTYNKHQCSKQYYDFIKLSCIYHYTD